MPARSLAQIVHHATLAVVTTTMATSTSSSYSTSATSAAAAFGPADRLQTQASLLERLRNLDDAESWNRFYQTYEKAVRNLARKRGLTDAESEEVAQEVFKRIAETIQNFEPASRTGSFRRWLFQLVRWRTEDKIRERGRLQTEPIGDHTTSLGSLAQRVPAPDDVEEAVEADARRQLMQVALERLKRRLNPRDLQIFHMLVIELWPVEKVAGFFHIAPTLVYVIRHRVGRHLRAELALIERRLQHGSAES